MNQINNKKIYCNLIFLNNSKFLTNFLMFLLLLLHDYFYWKITFSKEKKRDKTNSHNPETASKKGIKGTTIALFFGGPRHVVESSQWTVKET